MTYEYNNKTFTITFNVYATGTKKAINPLLQFSPGLYDDNDNMVASWDTLVNTYGMDLDYYEKDNIQYTLVYTDDGSILYEDPDGEIIDIDTIQTSRPSIILARTPELATGTKLIVPDTIGTLPYGALKGADNLNTIILKSGITEIGDHSISSCPNLGYVEIPNTVTKIGYCAFCESYAIALLTVPSSVTEIGEYAFDELDQVIYAGPAVDPDGFNWGAWELNTSATTNNASFLFEDYTKTKIIKYIGDDVDVIIPDGVVEIASHAFENKSYIKSIEIPNTVTKIGEKAFAGCTGLDYLIVPNTVNNIGFKAFEDVELLYFFGSATYSTNDSSSWGAKYKNVQRKGDYLLSSDGSVLYAYLGNDSDIVLPSTVLSVYYQAFKDNINLNNVFIPKNIIVFGSKVFDGCSNLNSIIFEKTNSWEATDYENPPDPLDVTNSSTNVTYFTDTYLYAIIENSELMQEYYKTSNGKNPMAQK